MPILTIDFEASCLPKHGRSFPIEVGIAVAGTARSWLIQPHRSWAGWDWTREAEALHGLSRAEVEVRGQPAVTVMAELASAVAGHRVVSDSSIDQYWLDTLATAAGMTAPFSIDHVAQLLDEQGADEDRIAAAVAFADAAHPERHRAASDALWLGALIHNVGALARPAFPFAAPMLQSVR